MIRKRSMGRSTPLCWIADDCKTVVSEFLSHKDNLIATAVSSDPNESPCKIIMLQLNIPEVVEYLDEHSNSLHNIQLRSLMRRRPSIRKLEFRHNNTGFHGLWWFSGTKSELELEWQGLKVHLISMHIDDDGTGMLQHYQEEDEWDWLGEYKDIREFRYNEGWGAVDLHFTKDWKLKKLDIGDDSHASVEEIDADLSELEELHLRNNCFVKDLEFLTRCPKLRVLDIQNTMVEDITPLKHCVALEFLTLGNEDFELDLTPLATCTNLKQTTLVKRSGVFVCYQQPCPCYGIARSYI